jgi:UDP-galactopyranose mutase
MKKAIILGAGFAGCTTAYLLKRSGWDCTVIEKEKHPGGGCRTFFYGGHPFTKGPRPYYGYSEKIFGWIDQFVPMRRFRHELLSYVEGEKKFFSYPIHQDDIPIMSQAEKIEGELAQRDNSKPPADFEEYWVNRVGQTLYEMFVKKYSQKMWLIQNNTALDTFNWSAKDKPIQQGTRECYQGSIIGYPRDYNGYNVYFEKMLSGVDILYGRTVEKADLENRAIIFKDGLYLKGDILISSIPIEELCQYQHGPLPYAGRDFIEFVLPCKQVFPNNIRFCHYTQDEPYTRIVEYKKLTYYESNNTLIGLEIPSMSNKLYPYMIKKYLKTAKQYISELPNHVFSIGRLGTYQYSTIEQTIAQAFDAVTKITDCSIDGIENEWYNIGDMEILKKRRRIEIK